MKKVFVPLLLCTLLLPLSCTESKLEQHQTSFWPLVSTGMIAYADQLKDTTHIISLDSWTVSSSVDWMTVTPTSGTVSNYTNTDTRLNIAMEANTTGKVRYGYIIANAYDQIAMPVTQYYWLNIQRPSAVEVSTPSTARKTRETATSSDLTVEFPMNVNAACTDTSIVFTVYQDNATLTAKDSWIAPAESTFAAGRHTVKLALEANTAAESRTGTLTLTSGGVSTDINILQAAQ